ncbi:Ankyrin repeat domain containing protein [Pandoravirus salinus]|uniref:Ankyrin repeat domain containing protein n=1 Tax=Pandoravirus salinus TaxID=1349410 RepID=S4W046_9VIRU|nr:ankyrin repeat domain [Pandoravirus salinus]AGO85156.1 Ankyrin repeat domain containing protein [Pandoravirus salinus]
MNSAARAGYFDIVRFLHENRTEGCTVDAMDFAARGGRLDIVKWLHENRSEGCTTAAVDGAVMSSHYDVARWLCENRTEGCTVGSLRRSIGRRNAEMALFLLDVTDHAPDGPTLAHAACLDPPCLFERLCLRPIPSGPSVDIVREAFLHAMVMNSIRAIRRLARRFADHAALLGTDLLLHAVAQRRPRIAECIVTELPSVCDPHILREADGRCPDGTCNQWSTFYRRLAARADSKRRSCAASKS